MNKLTHIIIITILVLSFPLSAQRPVENIRTPEYLELQRNLASGWNTWHNNNMLSQVYLPYGFSLSVALRGYGINYLRDTYKVSRQIDRPEELIPGMRSDDGSYTSMTVLWQGNEVIIESATDGDDLVLLITPQKTTYFLKIVIEAGVNWNLPGAVGRNGEMLFGEFDDRTFRVGATATPHRDVFVQTTLPSLVFDPDETIGIYTGEERTLGEIQRIIDRNRQQVQDRADQYGELADAFIAMQGVLAWNSIYDPESDRVITPVSRWWNASIWSGFVLFDWDTYFAAYMMSLFSRDLAYANAVEMTKAITRKGFIPNYIAAHNNYTGDRSQPPVGSFVVHQIYKQYQEIWFLEEVFDELLSWNRWWVTHRSNGPYLSWGSHPVEDPNYIWGNTQEYAVLESGLDNSPMYDRVPYNEEKYILEFADVGLLGFYILDCKSLADIARKLGKVDIAMELDHRAHHYTQVLHTLWHEEDGMFYNKRTDTGELCKKLSPTNFYPLLARAATQQQAERMISEYYFDPEFFYGDYMLPSIARNVPGYEDNSYWRGRIWAPMNFLVYQGLRSYDLPGARKDLVNKSYDLLMKGWREDGSIYENYNSETGRGDDVKDADSFYHWGALLAFISFLENGFIE